MSLSLTFITISLIVGLVTAGLKIQFDRFFAVVLLILMMKLSVFAAINVFLWIIMLSAAWALWSNRTKISAMPTQNKKKFVTLVPTLAFIGVFLGNIIFSRSSAAGLLLAIGIVAFFYGLRLIFIHFKPSEFEYKNEKPIYLKICGLFGPIVSGFFVGFVGTSLKPLKIPFAVKIGKLNLGQVYLGNTITAFYASFFAIILRVFYVNTHVMTLNNFFLGISLWVVIHLTYKTTNLFFPDKWRKSFQTIIGIILVAVAFKFI